jgi:hypothetical protein
MDFIYKAPAPRDGHFFFFFVVVEFIGGPASPIQIHHCGYNNNNNNIWVIKKWAPNVLGSRRSRTSLT